MFTIISAVIWILGLVLTWHFATEQKRSPVLWCIAGLILSPVATCIVLLVLKYLKVEK